MKKILRAHFIPNNHLDREWTIDFQWTRALTVEFFDGLIDILKKIPEYIFLLDSQTVPLEDYFEIRPGNEPIIKKFIRQGRINIGPWYDAPDMNIINGESITRNLLMGHRVASRYGPVMKIGYTPFGFGQCSQLPQIYRGFDIDICFFYRGITDAEAPNAEFVWESPDGSTILTSKFGRGRRVNFFFGVWRKSSFTRKGVNRDRASHWKDGQVHFRLCSENDRFDQGFLLKPVKVIDKKELKESFLHLIEDEKKTFLTPEVPFMQGMDTRAPDIEEKRVLENCQKYLNKGEEFFYSSLPRYARDLKKAIKGKRLVKVTGERRSGDAFTNVVSARPRQKILNSRAENILQRAAEPFAAIAYSLGEKWPAKYFELAWKYFLKCHPHDTIGGCGIDRIEEDTTYRLKQVISISKFILMRSLGKIQSRIDTSDVKEDEIVITVFNPAPYPRTEEVTGYINIPGELAIKKFNLYDSKNREIDYVVSGVRQTNRFYRDDEQIALMSRCDEHKISFTAAGIPSFGYRRYVLRRGKPAKSTEPKISKRPNTMENEHLLVKINRDGTINISKKGSGMVYRGLHYFQDCGEAGHAWLHESPSEDRIISSKGSKAEISMIENNNLFATCRVHYRMAIPVQKEYLDETMTGARRSRKTEPIDIYSRFTLRKGAKSIEAETEVINRSKDHRLRVMFPTGLNARVSSGESAYDVIDRAVQKEKQYPFLKFADISDGRKGFAFISKDNREYEAIDDADRTLAITLVRAFEVAMCTVGFGADAERLPEDLLSQCLGSTKFRYFIYPHKGSWAQSDIYGEADRLNYPLLISQASGENKGDLPEEYSFLEIKGKNLVLSAFKKAEDSSSIIIRVFNPALKETRGQIKFYRKIKSACFTNMDEKINRSRKVNFKDNAINISVPGKKVVTLSIGLVGRK